MAALDFPASPSNGATYTGPGGVVWTWDGSKWVTQGIATAYLPLAGGQLTGPLGAISGGPPTASINFGGTANTGLYGNANLVGIMSGGQARFTVDGTTAASQGPLLLPGAPTTALQAATKGYVDGFLPLTGGTLTGNLTIAPASGNSGLTLNKPTHTDNNPIFGARAGSLRWHINLGNGIAESGSNAGSNFEIVRYNDAGAAIDVPLSINRATGSATFLGLTANGVTSTSNSWFQTYTRFGNTTAPASTTQIGVCMAGSTYGLALRPNVGGVGGMLAFENVGSALIGSITNNDTSVAYNTSSDARLKEDARDFDAGPMIDATMVYDFAWIATGERAYGVIAQEAVEVYPQAVSYIELQDSWGVDYSKYIPLLLQELKVLRGRVAALEGGTPTP